MLDSIDIKPCPNSQSETSYVEHLGRSRVFCEGEQANSRSAVARFFGYSPSCSTLELREKGDKFFGSEETFLAGPQSLECLLHESEVGRDHRVNVHEEAQLFRVALPVAIQRRILILFRIVEAVNPESNEGGEVRESCGIVLPCFELSLRLIESRERLELTRAMRPMNEQPTRIEKVCLAVLLERRPFRQVMLGPKFETRGLVLLLYSLNFVVYRSRVNQFWEGS